MVISIFQYHLWPSSCSRSWFSLKCYLYLSLSTGWKSQYSLSIDPLCFCTHLNDVTVVESLNTIDYISKIPWCHPKWGGGHQFLWKVILQNRPRDVLVCLSPLKQYLSVRRHPPLWNASTLCSKSLHDWSSSTSLPWRRDCPCWRKPRHLSSRF